MDVALSRRGAWLLRAFFALIIVFLYAPIVVLLIFSFNDSALPTFPLSGFTLRWYHQFLTNPDLQDALRTSAIVAALSSLGAVILGLLAAIALVRHPFRGTGPVSALLLSPLVIPFIVFGISLLLLFHAVGVELGVKTVVIGHIVITIPYAMLVMIPRLQQIDASLEQAAYDLGASRLRTFRSITLPLMLPAVVSAYLIAFTTSFDEYAVASFVKGSTVTFPVYLYAALRFPNQLPQVIAVAVVVIGVSLIIVVAAEVGRRVAERRLGAPRPLAGCCRNLIGEQGGVLRLPRERNARSGLEGRGRLVGEAVADDATCWSPDMELRVHAEVDDLRDRALEPRSSVCPASLDRPDVDALRANRDAQRVTAASTGADRHDDALMFADPHHGVLADELVDRELERVERADEVSDERRCRSLVDLARTADLFHSATVHHGDPIGHGERLLLVMGDVDERRAQL